MCAKIRNLALLVFVAWAIKFEKKPQKLHLAVSGQKFSKSTPAHIRTGRRSRRRPPITIEGE